MKILWILIILIVACDPAPQKTPTALPPEPANPVTEVPESKRKLIIGIGEFPPYTGIDLPGQGTSTIKAREIFDALGLEYELSFLPWKRVEALLFSGEIDATFPYSKKNPERLKIYDYSDPMDSIDSIDSSKAHFVYSKKKYPQAPAIKTLADIKGLRICSPRGYWWNYHLEQAGIKYTELTNSDVGEFLASDRADISIMYKNEMEYFTKDLKHEFGYIETPWPVIKRHFMVKKGSHAEIIKRINDYLAKDKPPAP